MKKNSIADPTQMTEEELYRLNIYHATDENHSEKQLHSLYGWVNEDQDKQIIISVHGKRVLDVGAGYGTLSRRLKDMGIDVIAIEPNPHTREIAKKWNNVDELPYGIYQTPFDDNYFDTVIMRECVEHLDFPSAMREINRICKRRVLVFQTNLNPLITLARKRIGHEEFNPQKLEYYQKNLADAGFSKQIVIFRDPLAFPLSGGYHARQLVPRNVLLEHAIINIDGAVTKFLRFTKMAPLFCWRYLLLSDK
jgi:SAM-dependent methyltransferase